MVPQRAVLASLVCVAMAFAAVVGFAAAQKPTRSECIVGFDLDWSRVVTNRHDILNSLFDKPTIDPKTKVSVAVAVSTNGTRLYLQFRDQCSRKVEMAANLVAFWRSEGLELPVFDPIKGPIIPSPTTIDVQGPHWSDGQPYGIRPDDIQGTPEKDRKI
jgi:hypothetical protein